MLTTPDLLLRHRRMTQLPLFNPIRTPEITNIHLPPRKPVPLFLIFDLLNWVEQDILRLEIPVSDTSRLRMEVDESGGKLFDDGEGLGFGEGLGRGGQG